TSGIAIGLMLELTRHIGYENARLKAGETWQKTIGPELEGATLGILGLGKLGTRTAMVGKAFGMKVNAWSTNLTPEKCKEAGVDYVSKEDLFRQSDFVSIHVVLSQRSRGLVGAKELGLMKPTAYLINTSRGPIVDEAAMLAVLREKKIAGAGLDVFDIEPLPKDHPLRKMDNVVLTPHLGYVALKNYQNYFAGVVEDIRGFIDGNPVRVMTNCQRPVRAKEVRMHRLVLSVLAILALAGAPQCQAQSHAGLTLLVLEITPAELVPAAFAERYGKLLAAEFAEAVRDSANADCLKTK